MKEVYAAPQCIFDAVASRVVRDKFARGDLKVVRQK